MTCFELTTETPEEMITLLRGLNLEGTKNEPVYKVQKPTILRPEDVQTEEGLGEAPEKATPETDESPVDELIVICRDCAYFLRKQCGSFKSTTLQASERIKNTELAIAALIKAADVMEIMSKNLQKTTEGCVDTAVELVNCIHSKRGR